MPLGCASALDWKRRELPGGSLGPKACFAKIISVWFLSRGYQLGFRPQWNPRTRDDDQHASV